MKYIKLFELWDESRIKFIESENSIPQFRSYYIFDNGTKIGTLDLSFLYSNLKPDEIEIAGLIINPAFQRQNLGRKIIESLWVEYPNINKIYLQSIEESKGFWKKMGAVESQRENYWEINRR
jgi:ribosomal protein S18 acetylase RimI-like enzyme